MINSAAPRLCRPLVHAQSFGATWATRLRGAFDRLQHLPAIAVRDGATAADADGVARDDQRGRQLSPLELVGR
ncbi:MAG: hypothetical protein ACRD9R_05175 [Pyrinomonadaceae bacterium]